MPEKRFSAEQIVTLLRQWNCSRLTSISRFWRVRGEAGERAVGN